MPLIEWVPLLVEHSYNTIFQLVSYRWAPIAIHSSTFIEREHREGVEEGEIGEQLWR